MNAVLFYGVPALFSWRTLTANAFSARTLPCPTPAGIKLAMLGILLRRDGPESAQEHLSWLAPLTLAWRPADRMAISVATVRVWKKKKSGEELTDSIGMREYLHAPGLFGLAVTDIPGKRANDTMYALDRLRSLGNAESLIQPTQPVQWLDDLPTGFTLLNSETASGDVTVLLDDLGPDALFERLSVYRVPESTSAPRLNVDRRRFLAQLPLRVTRHTATGYVLERMD